jgi:hypothetical protein
VEGYVKHIWWHRIAEGLPNGNVLTGCGQSAPISMQAGSIDAIEMGNGCPECLPEKAEAALVEQAEAAAVVELQAKAAAGGGTVVLEDLSNAQLRALAAEHGIETKPSANKTTLIAAITAAIPVDLTPEPTELMPNAGALAELEKLDAEQLGVILAQDHLELPAEATRDEVIAAIMAQAGYRAPDPEPGA